MTKVENGDRFTEPSFFPATTPEDEGETKGCARCGIVPPPSVEVSKVGERIEIVCGSFLPGGGSCALSSFETSCGQLDGDPNVTVKDTIHNFPKQEKVEA